MAVYQTVYNKPKKDTYSGEWLAGYQNPNNQIILGSEQAVDFRPDNFSADARNSTEKFKNFRGKSQIDIQRIYDFIDIDKDILQSTEGRAILEATVGRKIRKFMPFRVYQEGTLPNPTTISASGVLGSLLTNMKNGFSYNNSSGNSIVIDGIEITYTLAYNATTAQQTVRTTFAIYQRNSANISAIPEANQFWQLTGTSNAKWTTLADIKEENRKNYTQLYRRNALLTGLNRCNQVETVNIYIKGDDIGDVFFDKSNKVTRGDIYLFLISDQTAADLQPLMIGFWSIKFRTK